MELISVKQIRTVTRYNIEIKYGEIYKVWIDVSESPLFSYLIKLGFNLNTEDISPDDKTREEITKFIKERFKLS